MNFRVWDAREFENQFSVCIEGCAFTCAERMSLNVMFHKTPDLDSDICN